MGTIAVVDYGMGNLRSVCKALEQVAAPGQRVVLASRGPELRAAERVVFPGQGAISGCMTRLREEGLDELLVDLARARPFLGICLGLQALFEMSEEGGGVRGLGLYAGQVRAFPRGQDRKVPHMGWNEVHQVSPHPLWRDIPDASRFYFVHSYYADPADPGIVLGATDYGRRFASAAGHGFVFAVQFHPEKSQVHGLTLLRNFCRWDGSPDASC